jgi:hypothetical protein
MIIQYSISSDADTVDTDHNYRWKTLGAHRSETWREINAGNLVTVIQLEIKAHKLDELTMFMLKYNTTKITCFRSSAFAVQLPRSDLVN